ncbi:endo-1,4-beta-xylanase [Flavobacterium sp. RHBU_24]|uniref:endo-1,4-beta-xylanase n=1 Tax=Flavobacterium sp. RHBU_24 TaxID=3391185 RepID=UPI003984E685
MKNIFLLVFTGAMLFLNSCSKDDNEGANALEAPVANPAKDVNNTGFRAKWMYVSTAQSYLLDISTSADFETFLPDYNSKPVTDLNEVVVGLDGGTRYFYRVRAKRDSEISAYSNVISVVTNGVSSIPEDPTFLKVKANALQHPFFVGMAVKASQLETGSQYDVILKNEFSSISAEYEMKMNPISVASGVYNWEAADKIVAYGNDNGINVHGHALVWHVAVPDWLTNYPGTDAEFSNEVRQYITDVVTHFAGKVTSWDVVNEAVDDTGNLRNTIFLQRMGPNYINQCFQWAREAADAAGDTDLLLFYNDYATSANIPKQNKVYELVDALKASNLINGVGFQMHNTYLSPTKDQIETDINRAVSKGLKIHISELDIQVNPFNDISTFTNERRLDQKDKYKEIVKIYNAIPSANKYALTIWGMRDNESWIPYNAELNHPGNDWPLLYDSNFAIKSAHTGFLQGLD